MSVLSFGNGKNGQLCQDTLKDHLDPTVIQALKGKRITQVSCGESHSLAITHFGDIYSWGRGKEGQLGNGEKPLKSGAQLIKSLAHERVTKVACGNFHSLAVTNDGKVYEWGQLHEIKTNERETDNQGIVQMPGIQASAIAEYSLSLYLSGEKKFYTQKSKEEEEKETKDNQQSEQYHKGSIGKIVDLNQPNPILLSSLKDTEIVDVSAGWAFSAAVSKKGELFTWGFNEKGQLGLGDRWFHGIPQHVKALSRFHINSVSCGRQHIGAITDKGELFTWGLGVFGQLGHSNLKSYLHPVMVKAFAEPEFIKIEQVACGANFTMARTSEGRLYSFGHGEYGQLGATEESQFMDWDKNSKDNHFKYSAPTLVKSLAEKKITYVACGHLHTIAITEDHETYAWGWGASGCLGFGDKKFQLVPQLVPALSGEEISSVDCGEKHSLVVRSTDISTFAFDYKGLLNDKKYADIILVVQDKKIYTHKFFLKARCPKLYARIVLDKKFNKDGYQLNEEGLREVHIPKVKYPIMMAFLNYIYSDHLIVAPHLRNDLAEFAISMGVPRLSSLCHRHSFKLRKIDRIPPSTFSNEITSDPFTLEFSDIHFKLSENELIPAHKIILSSRNDYFKTMFECGFRERGQKVYDVGQDISNDIFKICLEYIYGNDDSLVNADNAVDLLFIADRFMIEDLKLVCENFLEGLVVSNIRTLESFSHESKKNSENATSPSEIELENAITSFDNICLLLQVSDQFIAKRLKKVCMQTISKMSLEAFNILNKNGTLKKIRCSAPHLIRELDYYASKHGFYNPNHFMTLIR
eukprot:gene7415-9116_t